MAEPTKHETLLRRQTDPLWLQDYLMMTGSGPDTTSATVTFVFRKGVPYAVTCRHVVEALPKEAEKKGIGHPVLAIKAGKSIFSLAHWTASGLQTPFASPPGIDIALTRIDNFFSSLIRLKNKTAIDLDHWREPDWSKMKWGGAAGYPDEHKYIHGDPGAEQVATPFLRSVASVASKLGPSEPTITLSSRLDRPHSWYFSGLSGGPLCLTGEAEGSTVEDEDMYPAGIVYEGFPGSGRPDAGSGRSLETAFLNNKDLFFRAYTMTPDIFDAWVAEAKQL